MQNNVPLAERLRPQSLDEYIGQSHLMGEGGVIRRMIESGNVPSFILWGPPGVGKTTLAQLVASATGRRLFTLSAISSGVKDVREVLDIGAIPTTPERRKLKFSQSEKQSMINDLEKQMKEAARMLEFEYAAMLRDKIAALKGEKDD